MSQIVDTATKTGFESANKEKQLVKWTFRDEVFDGSRKKDIKELNEKFQMMKTMEMQIPGAVTDLIMNPVPKRIFTQKVLPESRKIFNINDSKCDILTGVRDYASKAALNTMDAGVREGATFTVYSDFKVPQIIVESVSDVENSKSCDDAMQSTLNLFKSRQSTHSEQRRRSKSYFRPYCIISRRHYTCRSFTHRQRKYGVSQKNSGFHRMDELTDMLDKMGTSESKTGKGGKWQYSPPPKVGYVQYRPPMDLSQIKEKSRSMNDLNFQTLNISSPPRNASDVRTAERSVTGTVCLTRAPVEQVLTKLNNLTM